MKMSQMNNLFICIILTIKTIQILKRTPFSVLATNTSEFERKYITQYTINNYTSN